MFREELKNSISKIFGVSKVTFESVGDKFEQDTIFIEIELAKSRPSIKKFTSIVTGSIVIYSQLDKLPYGFFSNRIEMASKELKKPFVFLNFEENVANSPFAKINLVERRVSFVYLYKTEHNPERGEITSLEIEG